MSVKSAGWSLGVALFESLLIGQQDGIKSANGSWILMDDRRREGGGLQSYCFWWTQIYAQIVIGTMMRTKKIQRNRKRIKMSCTIHLTHQILQTFSIVDRLSSSTIFFWVVFVVPFGSQSRIGLLIRWYTLVLVQPNWKCSRRFGDHLSGSRTPLPANVTGLIKHDKGNSIISVTFLSWPQKKKHIS